MQIAEALTMCNFSFRFYRSLVIIAVLFGGTGCMRDESKFTGGPHYFERVEMIKKSDIPVRPVRPLTADEAYKRNSYGVAFFDSEGRIVSYEDMVDGKIAWAGKFYYEDDGRIKAEYRNSDGNVSIRHYDRSGNIVNENAATP